MKKQLIAFLSVGFGIMILQNSCYYDKAETILGPYACDTLQVTFSQHIAPWVNTQCGSCHTGSFPSAGIALSNYTDIKNSVDNGNFWGSINHLGGFSPMPKSMPKTDDCQLSKIKHWINQGAPNN